MTNKGILSFIPLLLLTVSSPAQLGDPKLRPSTKYWDKDARHTAVHILRVSKSRKLAVVGDTLYMLNTHSRVIWTWSSGGPPFTDTPIIDSQGTLYVPAYDLTWVALDSATGKEKWRRTANGRAVYSQIKLYKSDMYLVVIDNTGYRDNMPAANLNDDLTLCKGEKILWSTEIPAGATIEVRGNKIVAVVKRKGRRLHFRIAIPQHFGTPNKSLGHALGAAFVHGD